MGRIAWGILVPFCVALAVVAVVTMVRENTAEPAAAAEQADTVVMEGLAFAPARITVTRGTEIVFDNNDVAPHTVTADDGSSDSGVIDPGGAYRLVANESFAYHCEIHPSMTAEVRLEG